MDEFFRRFCPGEQIEISGSPHGEILSIRGNGSFAWSKTLPEPLFRECLAQYDVSAVNLVDLPYLDDEAILRLPANHRLQRVSVKVDRLPGGAIEHPEVSHPAVTDRGLRHLCQTAQVEELILPRVDFTADGLAALAQCESLRFLWLEGGTIRTVPTTPFARSRLCA